MISSDTMKEESLNDYKVLISNLDAILLGGEFNCACAFVYSEHEAEREKVLVVLEFGIISIVIKFVSKYILRI